MNRTTLAVASAVVLAFAAGGWWIAKTHADRDRESRPATDRSATAYWTCTMHPQVHQDHPGNCPICGMTLVRREAHANATPGDTPMVVAIDPRMAQNLGMRTAPVTRGASALRIAAVGSVVIDENRIAVVEARAAGWVERLEVRAEGETVRAGQVVARVYSPDLLAVQEELALARKLDDPALVSAAQSRLKLLNVDPAAQPQRRTPIVAPQSGVVTELLVRQGAQVTPGMPLMKLADLSKVWMAVEVPESQSAGLSVGQPAEARLRGWPGRTFSGTVDHVYPVLDAGTRTVRARVAFDNAEGALKPGMYADVTLFGGGDQEESLVPTEAVIRTGTRTVVLVAEAQGRYRPVQVTLGPERGDQVVVRSGVEPGQQVVVSGQFLIDSEASLIGAYERMGGSPEPEKRP
jgi:Cu(I)/Ag(I) efflux system membrane fusion protein